MEVRLLDPKARIIEALPRSEEDLWTLALIIRKGDRVRTVVLRDVSGKDAKTKERRPIEVLLRVDSVEFQPFTGSLRVFGVIEEGPDRFGVKGRHQSAYLGLGHPVIIERDEGFDEQVLRRLRESGPRGRAIIAAVDYDEYALAVMTSLGLRYVESRSIFLGPKDDPGREERLRSLVDEIASEIVKQASELGASVAVIVGPGTIKEDVAAKVRSMAPSLKALLDSASSGGEAGVEEALRRDSVIEALRDLASARAQELMGELMRRVSQGDARVAYTPREVLKAARLGAVEALIVVDSLLYADSEEGAMAREAVEEAERKRGEVVIITEASPSALTLWSLGGVAALLRFKVEEGH